MFVCHFQWICLFDFSFFVIFRIFFSFLFFFSFRCIQTNIVGLLSDYVIYCFEQWWQWDVRVYFKSICLTQSSLVWKMKELRRSVNADFGCWALGHLYFSFILFCADFISLGFVLCVCEWVKCFGLMLNTIKSILYSVFSYLGVGGQYEKWKDDHQIRNCRRNGKLYVIWNCNLMGSLILDTKSIVRSPIESLNIRKKTDLTHFTLHICWNWLCTLNPIT